MLGFECGGVGECDLFDAHLVSVCFSKGRRWKERGRERERRDEVGVFYPKHFLLFLMCLLGYKSNLHSFSPGVFHSPLYFLSFLLSRFYFNFA